MHEKYFYFLLSILLIFVVITLQILAIELFGCRKCKETTTTTESNNMIYSKRKNPNSHQPQLKIDDKGIVISESFYDRDLEIPTNNCSKGLAGLNPRYVFTDERGYSCAGDQIHFRTQCCLSRVRYSCLDCQLEKGCCFEYSRCVSCCMNNRIGLGMDWDNCTIKCRTSSVSLLELNNPRFWDSSRPRFCFKGWRSADSKLLEDQYLNPQNKKKPCNNNNIPEIIQKQEKKEYKKTPSPQSGLKNTNNTKNVEFVEI